MARGNAWSSAYSADRIAEGYQGLLGCKPTAADAQRSSRRGLFLGREVSVVRRRVSRVAGAFSFAIALMCAGVLASPAVAAPSFEVELSSDANEVQAVYVDATTGQFRLNFGSGGPGVSETADLLATATSVQVEAALNVLLNISEGGGSVSVNGGPGGVGASSPYEVTFHGGLLAGRDVSELEAVNGATPLSGGASTVTVRTVDPGGVSRGDERVDYTVKVKNTAPMEVE